MQSLNISSMIKSLSPKSLSNDALLRNTQSLVAEERKLTTEILWHLHEIQVRRLYAEKGYASLFEYAVQVLGYSEAAAGRRIAAMRLLADVPEIEPALQKGEVSLSTLSTIQSFIQRKNSKQKSDPFSKAEKKELVLTLQGKTKRECEKVLVALDPEAALPKERERVVSSTQTEIRFVADDALMQKLRAIKELDGHVQCHPSYLELFHRMADLALKELDPLSQKRNTQKKPQKDNSDAIRPNSVSKVTPPAELKSQVTPSDLNKKMVSTNAEKVLLSHNKANPRYIPAALKREIWKKYQGQCAYKSLGGKRCGSRFALQVDHIKPVAWGGKSEAANLQLLCREHNRHKAVAQLGSSVMERYLRF